MRYYFVLLSITYICKFILLDFVRLDVLKGALLSPDKLFTRTKI